MKVKELIEYLEDLDGNLTLALLRESKMVSIAAIARVSIEEGTFLIIVDEKGKETLQDVKDKYENNGQLQ